MMVRLSETRDMRDEKKLQCPGQWPGTYFPVLWAGDIHVWSAFYHNNVTLIEQCRNAMTAEELAHISYFKFTKDQNNFIVSHGLLRMLLSSYLQISGDELNISKHQKGKPYQLNDPGLFFNLSNSGDCCIFAFSRNGEVGIDIEKIRPLKDLDELIKLNFNPLEQLYINKSMTEQHPRFFKLWTLKEAFLKAIGEGMRLTPDKLEFSCDNGEFKLQSFAGIVESDEWLFSDLAPGADYKGTLAHKKISGTLKMLEFNL